MATKKKTRRTPKGADVQGEGDYRSARRYDEATRRFVASHDTAKLGRAAAPRSAKERRDMVIAEEKARARGRGASPRSRSATTRRKRSV
jgi:hypothetical protein